MEKEEHGQTVRPSTESTVGKDMKKDASTKTEDSKTQDKEIKTIVVEVPVPFDVLF